METGFTFPLKASGWCEKTNLEAYSGSNLTGSLLWQGYCIFLCYKPAGLPWLFWVYSYCNGQVLYCSVTQSYNLNLMANRATFSLHIKAEAC